MKIRYILENVNELFQAASKVRPLQKQLDKIPLITGKIIISRNSIRLEDPNIEFYCTLEEFVKCAMTQLEIKFSFESHDGLREG